MDDKQFLTLIDEHQAIIHKICNIYRDTPEDREDLFQEIVFQLYKSAPSFQGKASFSSWMYRVALTTAIGTFRKRRPKIIFTDVLPDHTSPVDPQNEHDALFTAIRTLNEGEKALITLYLDDMSYQEIASITGITMNNVGVKLNRIKNKIQQLLNNKKYES